MKKDDITLYTYLLFRLGQEGISQVAIAKASHRTPAMVNYVIRGKRRCEAVEAVLLRILGASSWTELQVRAGEFQEYIAKSGKAGLAHVD